MTSNPSDLSATYDIAKFKWVALPTKDVDGSNTHDRLLSGGENIHDILHRYMYGDQTLFFAMTIDLLGSPVPLATFVELCRQTWIWLRYHIPTISCTTCIDDDDHGHLQYHNATQQSASEWANRTLCVHDGIDLETLRSQVGAWNIPSPQGDQTWLHVAFPSAPTDAVSTFGLLFHTHHAPFDGTGVKLIMKRYLTRLCVILERDNVSDNDLSWGTEACNLLPSVMDVLSEKEPVPLSTGRPERGDLYYESLNLVNESMVQSFQVNSQSRSAKRTEDVFL